MDEETVEQTILLARVALLERLVRNIMKEHFLDAADPVAAVDSYAERFSDGIEANLAKRDPEPEADMARIILTEQINDFFDLLKHDVRASLAGRQP